MPPTQANAPAWVPKEETIEYLLNKPLPKDYNKDQRSIKTLSQLSLDQRSRTGLCMFGKTTKVIPGDPYAYSPYWAGNVSHPLDVRMVKYLLIERCVY
jgi:hypothetical protein